MQIHMFFAPPNVLLSNHCYDIENIGWKIFNLVLFYIVMVNYVHRVTDISSDDTPYTLDNNPQDCASYPIFSAGSQQIRFRCTNYSLSIVHSLGN